MTPQQLSQRLETIADKAQTGLSSAVNKTQGRLYDDMQALLSRLELDDDGLIKQNQANRKLLQKADSVFDKAMKQSGYYNQLNTFADSVVRLTAANEEYFNFVIDAFTVDAHYIKSLQKEAILNIQNLLANDGLESQLKRPLKEILSQNVNTGASFADLLKQVREFIKGTPDLDGKLLRYSKQISRDTLFNYSASMQESISQNAGLDWYVYLGGIMDDSRDFCIQRAGNYYRKSEIESWAKLSWQGKRPGTTSSTIFIYRAGFNCLHQIIPVSESIVPEIAIKRAEQLGFL